MGIVLLISPFNFTGNASKLFKLTFHRKSSKKMGRKKDILFSRLGRITATEYRRRPAYNLYHQYLR